MQAIRRFFILPPTYENEYEQHRAQGVVWLAAFLLLLAAALAVVMVAFWTDQPSDYALVVFVPALVLTAGLSIVLARRGRLSQASWLIVGVALVGVFGLVASTGLDSHTAIGLALPTMLAGMMLNRRSAVTVALLTLAGIVMLGLLSNIIFAIGAFGAVLFFVGLTQWLFAGQTATTIARATVTQQQISLIASLSGQLITEDQPQALIEGFSRTVHTAFNLQQVQVYLQDPDNPAMIQLRGGAGLATQRRLAEGRALSAVADSPLARAYRQGQLLEIGPNDRAVHQVEFMPGTWAELIIPLRFGQSVFGVVDLQAAADQFSDIESTTLVTLTRQLSATLQNALLTHQLDEQTNEHEQLTTHMHEVSREVQQLRQQAAGVLWSGFFRERGVEVIGFDVPAQGAAPVPAHDLPVRLTDAFDSAKPLVTPTEAGYQLTVPIVLRGQVLGGMEFQLAADQTNVDRALDLANAIAERLSTSLENARLVEQTQMFAHREQAVGTVADRLQGAANLEDLLALAASEFNDVLGGTRTHIRLQLRDDNSVNTPPTADSAAPVGPGAGTSNGGGAA